MFSWGYRCAAGDTQMCSWGTMSAGDSSLRFCCLMDYVISTRISGKYICSNLNINVLQKNGFCRCISDQDKNITSFVARNIQGNFFLDISVNQYNVAETDIY